MDDTILCEAPGPGGLTCTLPYGHDVKVQPHHFAVEIPPDLGEIMEGIMRATEEAKVKYEKARRHERIMFYLWGSLCVLYLWLIVTEVFQ